MKLWRSILLLTLLLSGCENPPNCFYDNLFGCGTFDIPSNSSYYGFNHRAATTANAKTWNYNLRKTTTSCPGLKNNLTGSAVISLTKSAGTISLPAVGTLFGNLGSNRLIAKAKYQTRFMPCIVNIVSDLKFKNSNQGTVNARVQNVCTISALSCSAAYSGTISR